MTNSPNTTIMNSFNRSVLAFLLIGTITTFTSCKKEEETPPTPPPTNESELITTVLLTFTDPELNENYEMRFRDLDGDGGNAPVITADALPADRAFVLRVRILDESVSPARDLTDEIRGEAEEHQFFFAVDGVPLTITYSDQDMNGRPVGLENLAITTTAGTGSLKVTLRHELDKGAAGVAQGDITNAGGDTDIEVTFPLAVE
jgi:hypothetical protein